MYESSGDCYSVLCKIIKGSEKKQVAKVAARVMGKGDRIAEGKEAFVDFLEREGGRQGSGSVAPDRAGAV